jgi:hypothetical protein
VKLFRPFNISVRCAIFGSDRTEDGALALQRRHVGGAFIFSPTFWAMALPFASSCLSFLTCAGPWQIFRLASAKMPVAHDEF